MEDTSHEPVKDEDAEHPIADVWRPTLREIVKALAEGDYELSRGIPSVVLEAPDVAEQMRSYVKDYGETLTELNDETWRTSVAQWNGPYWDVLVDLWTVESGRSDMALSLWVYEADGGFRFQVNSLYVP